jgi:hypothetical protein
MLVFLIDTVLVPVLHMAMQDLVKGAGLNRIEQLLEAQLLLSNGVRYGTALLTRGSRHNCETEEGEDEQGEAQALNPWHIVRLRIGVRKIQRLLLVVSWSCSRKKSNFHGSLDLFDISWMHLVVLTKKVAKRVLVRGL